MPAYEKVLQWLLDDWAATHNKDKADKLWRVCKEMKAKHDANLQHIKDKKTALFGRFTDIIY